VTSFTLTVNELPVLTQPSPLELCDVNAPGDEMESFTLEDSILEILNGQTGMSVTFYETQLDADLGLNSITSPYTNITNPQTIYARAENDVTGCISTITLDLRVNPIPSPVVPTAQEVCDDDNDGFSSFDLESSTSEIINGELDISISYHETQGDAEQGVNALVSPYDNIVPTLQTVYARAENGLTGCFTVVELDLNVLPSPEIPLGMDDHVVCDDDDDGFTGFDLSEMDSVILGSQDASLFILSYHLTQADADLGSNPIVNVTNYTNISNPQTLYVRLESITNGCVSTGSFDIRVELPPIPVQPTPLEECDDDIADEITVFDLTLKDGEITGGNGSWSVGYYLTDADAQGDVNVIDPATSYTNTSVGVNPANPQTLYVRVTDTDTGCYAFTTLTIRVLPNPTPSMDPSDLELCDDTNTGDTQEEFDLTLNQEYIINGEAGVSATYHESLEDAHLGSNAIVNPTEYTNTSATQTIWVRVTNDITGCYTLVSFDIIVHALPDVIAVTDYIVCEVDTDGFWSFDLESKTDEVLNGQDALEYAVSYHLTQGDAELGVNDLVSPYTNITNPQQIFVNITNTLTGCDIATVSFNIEVQQGAEANSDGEVIVYALCDDNMEIDGDPSNDSVQFDLTVQDGAILDGQDPLDYTVSYYESLSDAELGFNPLPTLYENISNPQQIWARVDNDTTLDSICYAVTELTLLVEPLPVFDLAESFVLCVDTNGTEIIDPPVIDTGLSELDYSFVWQFNGVDIDGATGSSLTPTAGGSYSVIVMDNETGCQNTDTVAVSESSPPIVSAQVSSLAFAEDHVIEAVATGPGEYEYSLDDGPWQSSGTFTGVSAGDHVVTARDINGCGIATTTVLVIDYPLYFTPNGDGYHDTWNIVGIATQPNAKIYIFDRYGKLLKQLSPTGEGWNGTYNGAPLPSSDYWFTVVYDEPSSAVKKEFKAHFTLKR
jgi:gliding motility-associated-like protein